MSDQFSVLIADDNLNNLFTLETLISAHMEARILRDPGQWFWVHNRWKADRPRPAA